MVRHEELLAQLGWVQRLARSLVRDPSVADDVAQEAMVLALERPPRAVAGPGLRAWLARVTRSLARTSARGETRRRERERVAARPASAPGGDVVERGFLQRELVEAVMELDEPYRTTVLLRYLDDLPASAIARRTGANAATVRKRLSRGLAALRERLDRRWDGGRGAWLSALVPLARVEAPSGAAAAGALVVSTQVKSGIGVVVLAVGALWMAPRMDELSAPDAADAQADAQADVAVPATSVPGPAAVPDARSAQHAADALARTAVVGSPVAAAAPAERSVRFRAVAEDEDGLELTHATIAAIGGLASPPEPAGDDGTLLLELDLPGALRSLRATVAVRAEGYLPREVRLDVQPGGEYDLGRLRLTPVGAVSGLVVDGVGRPIEGASVCAVVPELNARNRETMELWGPPHQKRRATVRTDADGRFVFPALASGTWRIWAGTSGLAWSFTEPFRLANGAGPGELRLWLLPVPAERAIAGVVQDPRGNPVPGAEILVALTEGAQQFNGYGVADDEGRFAVGVETGRLHDVRVRHDAYGTVTRDDVRAGEGGLVLRFPPPREVRLVVRHPDGEPVSRYALRVGAPNETWPIAYSDEERHEGRAELVAPDRPFVLKVMARGCRDLELGPFDPGRVPATIEAVLEPLPVLRVRFTVGGEALNVGGGGGVAGVELVALHGEGELSYVEGFPTVLDRSRSSGAVGGADRDGVFRIPLPEPGTYVLMARRIGGAPIELGPFTFGPTAPEDVLVLELPATGGLAGRVFAPDGGSPAGATVEISRGDGNVHRARVGAEGEYSFEGLAPGPWIVRARRTDGRPGAGFASAAHVVQREPGWTFPGDVEVRADEVVRHDVELEAEGIVVTGRLTVDGVPVTQGSVRVVQAPFPWHWEIHGSSVHGIERDGSFRIEGLDSGPHWLVAQPAVGPLAGARIARRVDVSGSPEVWFDVDSGVLELSGAAAGSEPVACVTELPEGFAVVALAEPGGPAASVVAGDVRIVAWTDSDPRPDPRAWTERGSVRLAPGGAAQVTLDE